MGCASVPLMLATAQQQREHYDDRNRRHRPSGDCCARHARIEARIRKSGVSVPPRGSHIEWGTGNWCIMFERNHYGLRGIVDASRYTHALEHFLEKRVGQMGVAFRSDTDNRDAYRNAIVPSSLELEIGAAAFAGLIRRRACSRVNGTVLAVSTRSTVCGLPTRITIFER